MKVQSTPGAEAVAMGVAVAGGVHTMPRDIVASLVLLSGGGRIRRRIASVCSRYLLRPQPQHSECMDSCMRGCNLSIIVVQHQESTAINIQPRSTI